MSFAFTAYLVKRCLYCTFNMQIPYSDFPAHLFDSHAGLLSPLYRELLLSPLCPHQSCRDMSAGGQATTCHLLYAFCAFLQGNETSGKSWRCGAPPETWLTSAYEAWTGTGSHVKVKTKSGVIAFSNTLLTYVTCTDWDCYRASAWRKMQGDTKPMWESML